ALTLKPGDKVDNYEIVQQVGAGGSAVVFAAYDAILDRTVAVKQIVIPTGEDGDQLRQHAVAEAQHHRKVSKSDPAMLVTFIDVINDPRGVFLISEFVDGPSLEWILQSEPAPMEQRQALGILAATSKGLASIHAANMVHRDLKPANIMLPRGGGLKIADFGLAAALSEQQAMDLGSVRYMAPELLQGEPGSPSSDLYSLGMIAYEMLAGRDKFNEAFRTILRDQRNQAMRWMKWHTNPRAKVAPLNQLVPEIPQSLSDLVARMMEKEPSRRVGTSAELMDAIRNHFAAGEQQGPVPTPPPHSAMQPGPIGDASETAAVPKKSKVPMILGAMVVLWGVAIGGYLLYNNAQKNQQISEQIAGLADELDAADQLHIDNDYAGSRAAFLDVRQALKKQLDASPESFRAEIIELGQLTNAGIARAEGLLHVEAEDYIAAAASFNEYKLEMAEVDDTLVDLSGLSLSLNEADSRVQSNKPRANFQEIAQDIESLLDNGELEEAIVMIRTQRDMEDMAEADAERLASLDARYRQLRNTANNNRITAQAMTMVEDGDIDDAIDLLQDTIDEDPEAAAPEHKELLASLELTVARTENDRAIARAENRDDTEALIEALSDRIAFDPEPEAFQTRYDRLINDRDTSRASDLIGEDKLNEAVAILTVVLERNPNHRLARELMAGIGDMRAFLAKKREAEQAFGRRDYPAAIRIANEAIDLGGDRDGRMNEIIDTSTGEMAFADATEEFAAGNLDESERLLGIARDKLGNTQGVLALETQIDELREYSTLVAEGDTHFRRGEYGPAKRKYLAAREIFSNAAITEKIRECDCFQWLAQCDVYIARQEWVQAESALSSAEGFQINDETRARREILNNRQQ
ncbi:MAG: protein kinase, partial [Planctomycetota bacterium]